MKLLTHNMLTSHVKGVKNGYPLVINVSINSLGNPSWAHLRFTWCNLAG